MVGKNLLTKPESFGEISPINRGKSLKSENVSVLSNVSRTGTGLLAMLAANVNNQSAAHVVACEVQRTFPLGAHLWSSRLTPKHGISNVGNGLMRFRDQAI